ncbi:MULTISPECIES: hypothetical protein [Sorangium]|uniref:Uncharacterized protein n=1 Tax=Sorangium cellulosum TaxID=56 RepID=A0A4P2QHS1_SORCE|nr:MULTISPECIES: hypothetical protein [Sorangium]AUX29474.1 uncharacterized protein SOCE836_015640 [Sorangium cellulosum]WCQ88870.1 hypothetical protein NQZ70_01552 [Sorangium sp. Soce836]
MASEARALEVKTEGREATAAAGREGRAREAKARARGPEVEAREPEAEAVARAVTAEAEELEVVAYKSRRRANPWTCR